MDASKRKPSESTQPGSARPLRILIVEDNLDSRQFAQQALARAGYAADVAADGDIAASCAQEKRYDLLFMDLEMPRLDGFQATARIRQHEAAKGLDPVPIVAVTEQASQPYRRRCMDAGADHLEPKPTSPQRLIELAARWADRRPVILAADDTAVGRTLLRALIRREGCYRLLLAEEGRAAVELFKREQAALVLLDMEMPVLNGYGAAAEIRALPHGEHVPIIALTCHSGREEVRKMLAAGCTAHLAKPLRRPELQQLLQQFLSTHGAPASAQPQPHEVDAEIRELIPEYAALCRRDAGKLRSMLKDKLMKDISVIGHNMKGTAPSYGFTALADIAARLEAAARAEQSAQVAALVEELEAHVAGWSAGLQSA